MGHCSPVTQSRRHQGGPFSVGKVARRLWAVSGPMTPCNVRRWSARLEVDKLIDRPQNQKSTDQPRCPSTTRKRVSAVCARRVPPAVCEHVCVNARASHVTSRDVTSRHVTKSSRARGNKQRSLSTPPTDKLNMKSFNRELNGKNNDNRNTNYRFSFFTMRLSSISQISF